MSNSEQERVTTFGEVIKLHFNKMRESKRQMNIRKKWHVLDWYPS